MKLYCKSMGNGAPLFILHGVLGSSDNWLSAANVLSQSFKVYLIDQRNHGQSPHSQLFNYEIMAQDIAEIVERESIEKIHLLGHSMGGKTSMTFACQFPDKTNKLISLDMGVRYYPPHHQHIFAGMKSLNLATLRSRKEADEKLAHSIQDPMVRQFILKNLKREGDTFKWKLNREGIESNIEEIGKPLAEISVFNGPTLFLSGAKSDYVSKGDFSKILQHFPKAQFDFVANAGHWVHVDNPQATLDKISHFLTRE